MALTKVTGDFIKAGSITQGHLHSSHGITTSHIAEGDKLFFTNARVDSRIGSLSTSDLSEGTNLYYTDARARAAISGTGSLSYNSTTGVMSFTMPAQNTSNITEGSNLYYTDARADARIALQVGSNLDLSSKSTSDLSEGTNLYYTDARADARVALIVDSAPGTLNTLNELAAALGDDANFSTTVTNSIALKAPLASPSFTGNATFAGNITTTGSSITVDPASGDAILVLQSPTQTLRIDQNSIRTSTNSPISFLTNSTTALVLDTSQNATFSGDITVTGGSNLSTLDLNAGTVWDATTQGTGKGALHLDPNSATDHAGAAITFGASDASNGTNAQAGIYIRSDGSYGTKMYFSTTDSYATGSKTAMNILHNGQVNITRSNLVVNSDVRATVFYDSNDTTYYIDPASTSTSGKFRQYVNIGDSSSYSSNTGTWGARLNVVDNVHAKIDVGQDADSMLSTWYTHTGHSGAYFGMVTGHNLYLTSHNATRQVLFNGYSQENGSYRAPIFYSSTDTNSYLNNAQLVLRSGDPTIYFRDTNHRSVALHNNSNRFYVLGAPVDSTSYTQISGVWPWYVQLDTNDVYTGRIGYAGNSYRAPVFYDSNDTSYFLNPSASAGNALKTIGDWRQTSNSWSGEVGGKMQYHSDSWYLQAAAYVHFRNASGTNTFHVSGGGVATVYDYLIGTNSLRSPIFYDSDDTNYYVDPAGTSRLYHAQNNNGSEFIHCKHSGSDFASGTLVTTDIPANATNGASYIIEVTGKSYSGEPPFAFKAQGYLYNNTIINHSGISYGKHLTSTNQIKVFNHSDNKLAFWWPRISYWNSFEVRVRDAGGGSRNRALTVVNSTEPSSSKKVTTTLSQAAVLGYNYGSGSLYSDRLYDSNDTSYYVDANSTSNINKIQSSSKQAAPRWDTAFYVLQAQHWYGDTGSQEMFIGESGNTINIRGSITAAGVIDCNAGHGAINITNSSILSSASSSWTGNPGGAGKIQYHSNRWYIVADSSSNRIVQFRRDGSDVSYIDNSGRLMNAPDLRVPIYYDTNTAYYGDFGSHTHLNTMSCAGGLLFGDNYGVGVTGLYSSYRIQTIFNMGASYKLPNDGNSVGNAYGLYWSHQNAGTKGGANNLASHGLLIIEGGSYKGSWGGGRLVTTSDIRGTIFYDYNNTGYYTDPGSTSVLNALQFNYTQHGSANNIRMGNSTTMNAISSGTNNAAFGVEALGGCSTGSRNFAYGYAALGNLSSGGSNIAMGDATGYNVTSGSNNLLFGQNAGRTGYQSPYQSIAGITSGSNQIHMGNENHTTARIQISWTVNSDARDKTDVNPLDLGLEFVKKLNPVTYRWDKRSDYEDRTPDGTNKLPELTLGFLAQEVEVVEKSFGYDVANKTNLVVDRIVDQDHYGITYEKMVPVLTKAIQEQQAIIDDLKSRLETLENN